MNKLKLIVAAAGLVLSAASQAALVPPSTVGGSDLLLDVWEQGAPNGAADQSFTLDLGVAFTNFVNGSSSSSTLATLLSTDATWTNFLASSDTTDAGVLQWSVVASGSKGPVNRPAIIGTVTVGSDPTTAGAAGHLTNGDINTSNTQISAFFNQLGIAGTQEQTGLKGSGLYYQDTNLAAFNAHGFNNGNAIGATANVETATLVPGATSGAALMASLTGTMTFAQVGGNYVLSYNVAAVPEAPGMGMALAGVAALGFLALRRRNAA